MAKKPNTCLPPAERRKKQLATRLNRTLHLEVVKAEAAMFARHLKAMKLLEQKAAGRVLSDLEREYVREHRMTNRDLFDRRHDLSNRYGDPVRRQVDLDLEGAAPTVLVLPDDLWEGDDAAGPARG